MAESLSQPLAEALVKVRLVYDKQEVKNQTNTAVQDSTKAYKQQMVSMRKDARAFGIIGREIGKVANLMFKTVVAPVAAISALGVHKFLKTTDAGANVLKNSFRELTLSWYQLLARIGAAVNKHGRLNEVVLKLKKFIDGIDEQKILRMLSIAKWTAILAVIMKITSQIFIWTSEIIRFRSALMWLNLGKGMAKTAGGIAGGTAAGQIGGSLLGGVIGGAGVGGGIAGFKGFAFMSKLWKISAQLINESSGKAASTMTRLALVLDMAFPKFAISFIGVFTLVKNFVASLSKVAGWIALLIIPFDALVNVLNRNREAGEKLSKLGILWNVSTMPIRKLWNMVELVGSVMSFFTNTLTEGLEFLYTALFDRKNLGKMFKQWADDWQEWWENLRDIFRNFFGMASIKKDKKYEFSSGTSTLAFEGLTKAAQEMADKNEEINILKKIEENTRKSNDNNAPINNGSRGSSPFLYPGDMTIPRNIPNMLI